MTFAPSIQAPLAVDAVSDPGRGPQPSLRPEWIEVRVARRWWAADEVVALVLECTGMEDSGELPAFAAGAHVDVEVPAGVRQYSLCSDPADTRTYMIAVQRECAGRGGSRFLAEAVKVGQTLRVGRPRNLFALHADTREAVLLAGGIGITPMMAMAHALAAKGTPYQLHYSGRAMSRMAFAESLGLQDAPGAVHLYADDALGAPRIVLSEAVGPSKAGRHLYVCGPAGFMQAVLDTARAQGWPESQLHWEHFGAPPAGAKYSSTLPPAEGEIDPDGAFDVVMASTGRRITVQADKTVAEALEAAGVPLRLSCGAGVCGACRTSVLQGRPDHRDHCLSDEEQTSDQVFTPCCSRSLSAELLLDL